MRSQAPEAMAIHVSGSQLNLLKRRQHSRTANNEFGFSHFHTSWFLISSGVTRYQVTGYNGFRDCRVSLMSPGTYINYSVKSGTRFSFCHKGDNQCHLPWEKLALLVKAAAFSLWVFKHTQENLIQSFIQISCWCFM